MPIVKRNQLHEAHWLLYKYTITKYKQDIMQTWEPEREET